jgi:nitroreductase
MNVMDAIYTRRSCREFKGSIIDEEQLISLLNAGFAAPSAHNFQPWEFIVVRDQAILETIETSHEHGKMLTDAGCAIVVCGNTQRQSNKDLLIQDCAAAMQNMLLAAHGLHLGGVWVSCYPNHTDLIRQTLEIPEEILPIGLVVVGPKAVTLEPSKRFDEAKIHYDHY